MIYVFIVAVITVFVIVGCSINKKQDDQMKDSYLRLSETISAGDQEVSGEISLYFNNKVKYFKKFERDLFERGIESPEEIPDVIVLVDSLMRHDKIAYQDHSSEPGYALGLINKLSGNELEKYSCYETLLKHFRKTKYGIGSYLDLDIEGPSIFECVKSQGYRLLSINEDSDSYPLFLVKESNFIPIKQLASDAGVQLHFENK